MPDPGAGLVCSWPGATLSPGATHMLSPDTLPPQGPVLPRDLGSSFRPQLGQKGVHVLSAQTLVV